MPTIQNRRATAAQWTAANPVLAAGEIGFELDTNAIKIGDGLTRWKTLSYLTDESLTELVKSGRLSEAVLNDTYALKDEVASLVKVSGLGVARAMLALAPSMPCAVVFLGSSTTESAYSEPDNKYPNIVTAALQRAYPSDVPSFTVRMPSSTVSVVRNTAPGIHGYNGGRSGTRSDTYITASDLGNIDIIQPAIIVHAVGANDWHAGTAPATYKTQMLAALDSLDAIADGPLVHVLVHQHSRNVTGSSYTWDQYGTILRQIATERPGSCVFVDASETFYALGIPGPDPLGLGHSDKVHLVDGGNWVLAEQVTQAIANVGSRPPLMSFGGGELPPTAANLTATVGVEADSPTTGPVTRTFPAVGLGPEDPTRTILVAVTAWGSSATGGTLAEVSIGGVSATIDFTSPAAPSMPILGFARLAVPTGTSADITVTVGVATVVARWGVAVIAVTGGPIAPAGAGTVHPNSVSVAGANGGLVLASAYRPGGAETWGGTVEPLWSQPLLSPRRFVGGVSTAAGTVSASITLETSSRVAAIPYRRTG